MSKLEFIKSYLTNTIKICTSYPVLIAAALFITIILSPIFIFGTNTGEDACVYTSPENKSVYIKEGDGFVEYDPATHDSDAKTYVTNGSGYYRNKANWRFMDTPCRLTEETLIMGGILFWLTFVALGIFRVGIRKFLQPNMSLKN